MCPVRNNSYEFQMTQMRTSVVDRGLWENGKRRKLSVACECVAADVRFLPVRSALYINPQAAAMRAEGFALQLRALCSDHPVDGPSFDQVALRVALSFGRVVAEDEPAGQLGRRTQHSLVMLDHGI